MNIQSGSLAKLVPVMPDLMSLSGAEARIVLALRLAVLGQKSYQDVRPALEARLGSTRAVNGLLILIETLGHAWPEKFIIGRACCPQTTPDEMLFLTLLRQVVHGDRRAFDLQIGEMVGDEVRQRVYTDLSNFVAVYGSRNAR